MTADFCRREPAVLAGYVAALDRALRYIAGHFHETAELMVQAIPGDPGSVDEMEARIRRENRPHVRGTDAKPLLFIDPAKVRNFVTILYRYHRLDLPGAPE